MWIRHYKTQDYFLFTNDVNNIAVGSSSHAVRAALVSTHWTLHPGVLSVAQWLRQILKCLDVNGSMFTFVQIFARSPMCNYGLDTGNLDQILWSTWRRSHFRSSEELSTSLGTCMPSERREAWNPRNLQGVWNYYLKSSNRSEFLS